MKAGILALAAAAVVVTFAGCEKGPAGPASTGPSGAIDAQAVLRARCARCHSLQKVEDHQFDRSGWEDVIDEMIEKGARLSAAERLAVVEFLARRDADALKTEAADEDDDETDGDDDDGDDDGDDDE